MAAAEAGDSASSGAAVPIAETLQLIPAAAAQTCSMYCWAAAIRALLQLLRGKPDRTPSDLVRSGPILSLTQTRNRRPNSGELVFIFEAGMESAPKSVKYHVQVVRLRFDAAIIEVDATDDSDAERKAVEQAQRLSDADWQLQPFDHNSYQPHAETMVAEDELMESEEVDDALAWNDTRYLLLKGRSRQGAIVMPYANTEAMNKHLEEIMPLPLSRRLEPSSRTCPRSGDRLCFADP